MCLMCENNRKCGIVILIIGLLYLIKDYGLFDVSWWKLSWYTVIFLAIGLGLSCPCKLPKIKKKK